MLKGLKRYDKDAKLSFLAYQNALEDITIKHSDDIFLQFAPILRNHNVPLVSNDEKNMHNRSIFENLCKQFNDIEILEYYLDVSYFCEWNKKNIKNLEISDDVLEKDAKYYAECGAKSITSFAGFVNDDWFNEYGDSQFVKYGQIISKYFK